MEKNLSRQVFDCFMFNGEIEVLEIRLAELDPVVDVFVLVEGTKEHSGKQKELFFRKYWPRLEKYWLKLRCVVVDDFPETENPWDREQHQRNAVVRGILDAGDNDLILISDVDEIPRADIVRRMREDTVNQTFGLRLRFYYFALNYRNIEGPESAITWSVGCSYNLLEQRTPDSIRYEVRDGRMEATIFDDAGWHFSYLSEVSGIRKKIAAFSHQEFNTPEFINAIDVATTIQNRGDLFGRPGFVWAITSEDELPLHVRVNRGRFSNLLLDFDGNFITRKKPAPIRERAIDRFRSWWRRDGEPVIICPYIHDHHVARVKSAFRLYERAGRRLHFFLWKDENRIGPERAFQLCWNLFPRRDIIMIHTDMRPMPDDTKNHWYDALLENASRLPDAGAVACDLLFPDLQPDGSWQIQCAGGLIENGAIAHINRKSYDIRYQKIRRVAWVTFGGVFLRREVLDQCGSFDNHYQWAYVMDVDYSFEIRRRGYNLYQIPVNLLHDESGTTKEMLAKPEYQSYVENNLKIFYQKWSGQTKLFKNPDPHEI
jgi:hypothetical protein